MKIQSKVYLCSMDSAESGGGIEGRCKVLVTAAVCARNQRTRGGRCKNPTAEGHPVRVWNYYFRSWSSSLLCCVLELIDYGASARVFRLLTFKRKKMS